MPDTADSNQKSPGPNVVAVFVCVVALSVSARAKETYRLEDGQWQKQTALDPSKPEGQLHAVRKALAEGHAKRARKLADRWIERHPESDLIVEAYLVRGDAWVAQGHFYKALFDYEYLARSYPASEHFLTALERELEIARLFDGGTKRRFLGLRVLPADSEAEELYIRIQERAPGSAIGEKASLALAEYYFRKADMGSATAAYELFLDNYPKSQHRKQAMQRLIAANLATFKGPTFDPTGLVEAGERLKGYKNQFPAADVDSMLVRIEESLALKSYYGAQWYEKQGRTLSAVYTYRRVIRDHPRTAAAELAIQQLGRLGEPVTVPTETATKAADAEDPQRVSNANGGPDAATQREVRP